jgi:hypothetical protein
LAGPAVPLPERVQHRPVIRKKRQGDRDAALPEEQVQENLMEDERFCSRIENVAKGSKANAEVSLRLMGRICALLQVTQLDLAGMSKGDAGDFILRSVSRLEKDGNRSSTTLGYVKSFKSWWLFNDLEVTRHVRRRQPFSAAPCTGQETSNRERPRSMQAGYQTIEFRIEAHQLL